MDFIEEELKRVFIEEELKGATGLYVNPDLELTSVCDLQRQLQTPSPLYSDRNITTREDLIAYARLFEIPAEGTDQELAEKIQRSAPCEWIQRVYRWAQGNPSVSYDLNRYVTDIAMMALTSHREGTATPDQIKFLKGVNEAVKQSPRPDRGFKVYRGSYSPPGKVGEYFILDTPKSGSFAIDPILSGYVKVEESGDTCCVTVIYVPRDAVVSYHPSEDQVIFPEGARFYIMSGPFITEYSAFGQENPTITYHAIYVGPGQGRSGATPYDQLPLHDAYYFAVLQNRPFPYGDDPYRLLDVEQVRNGKINLTAPEIRLYLLLAGYNITPVKDYNQEQMIAVLKSLRLV